VVRVCARVCVCVCVCAAKCVRVCVCACVCVRNAQSRRNRQQATCGTARVRERCPYKPVHKCGSRRRKYSGRWYRHAKAARYNDSVQMAQMRKGKTKRLQTKAQRGACARQVRTPRAARKNAQRVRRVPPVGRAAFGTHYVTSIAQRCSVLDAAACVVRNARGYAGACVRCTGVRG